MSCSRTFGTSAILRMKLVLLLSAVLAAATAGKSIHKIKAGPRKEGVSNGTFILLRACVDVNVSGLLGVLMYG